MTDPAPHELCDALEALIVARPYASFVEIQKHFPREGEDLMEMAFERYQNVVLWSGLPRSVLAALCDLLEAGRVHMHPASSMIYMIDGACPRLPMLKRLPRQPLKKRHWLPVTFKIGAHCADKECPARPRRTARKRAHHESP